MNNFFCNQQTRKEDVMNNLKTFNKAILSALSSSFIPREYKARYYGFRAKIERKDNGYLLKIFGDSQQEVNEVINVVLKQGFDLRI